MTDPSARLRTVPTNPRAWASSRVDARYQTPCTRPMMLKRAQTMSNMRLSLPERQGLVSFVKTSRTPSHNPCAGET